MLTELARPLFRDVARLRELHGADEAALAVRRQELLGALAEFRAAGEAAGVAPREVDDSVYGIVALIDEQAMGMDTVRPRWIARPLQVELFGEHRAGEGFFERLESARERGRKEQLELYLTCLYFGFMGKLRAQGGAPAHQRLVAQLAEELSQLGQLPDVQPRLSPPHREADEGERRGRVGTLPLWIGVGVAWLGAVAYLGTRGIVEARYEQAREVLLTGESDR